jgi:hypothetical protein
MAWVKGGEDVMVRGEPVARPKALEQKVDWSHSAAFRDRRGEPVLTQRDLDELI